MLKQRVLTALMLGSLVIWAVFALPAIPFALLLASVVSIGAWEWTRLAGIQSSLGRGYYVLVLILTMLLLWYGMQQVSWVLPVLLSIVLCWWLLGLVWILRYVGAHKRRESVSISRCLAGIVVLAAPFASIVALRNSENLGPVYVMFLLLLIWVADSSAYFMGKRWGRNKLAPRISPGKTWEGVWGAILVTLLTGVIAGFLFEFPGTQILAFTSLCVVTVTFSILGDLLESMFKRDVGLKDSSHILPGHGGLLDRIDSLTAAAPVFILGLLVLRIPE